MKSLRQKKYQRIIIYIIIQGMLLSLIINNNLMKRLNYFQPKHMILMELILGFIVFVMNICVIFIVNDLYSTWQREEEFNLNQLKYNFIKDENRKYIKHKHDIKNHILIMNKLLETGEHKKLKNYLGNYSSKINSMLTTVDTGCKEVDILLYSKINEAKKRGIHVRFISKTNLNCNPDKIIDLISILSNILDNAIEACDEIIENKKIIVIELLSNPLDYIFIINNSYEKNIDIDHMTKEQVSTKGKNRGYGMSIIKEKVEELEGVLNININKNCFELKLNIAKYIME